MFHYVRVYSNLRFDRGTVNSFCFFLARDFSSLGVVLHYVRVYPNLRFDRGTISSFCFFLAGDFSSLGVVFHYVRVYSNRRFDKSPSIHFLTLISPFAGRSVSLRPCVPESPIRQRYDKFIMFFSGRRLFLKNQPCHLPSEMLWNRIQPNRLSVQLKSLRNANVTFADTPTKTASSPNKGNAKKIPTATDGDF